MSANSDTIGLVNALREIEAANEAVCSLRSQDIYLAMIAVPGTDAALLRLDSARRHARELVKGCS